MEREPTTGETRYNSLDVSIVDQLSTDGCPHDKPEIAVGCKIFQPLITNGEVKKDVTKNPSLVK